MEFGWPSKIHSDLGGEFTSNLFAELHRISGIKPSKTTPYHPEGNGKAERFNRTLCGMLKTLSEESKRDWRTHLPKLSFAYNSTIHKSTGFSPFKLLFGRESTLPIDFMFQGVEREAKLKNQSHERFLKEWGESMEEACKVAREKMEKMNISNKERYDKKAKAVEVVIGDHVLMQNRRDRKKVGTRKLDSYWEHNIFEVIEKKEDLPVYRIRNLNRKSDVRVVHRNLLMQCNDLPLDVFKEQVAKDTSRQVQQKQRGKVTSRQRQIGDDSEESDDDVVVVHPSRELSEEPIEVFPVNEENEVLQDVSDILSIPSDEESISVTTETRNEFESDEITSEAQVSDPVIEETEPEVGVSDPVVEEPEAEIEESIAITEESIPIAEESETVQEERQVERTEGDREKVQNDSGVEKVLILEDMVEDILEGSDQKEAEDKDSEESSQPLRRSDRTKEARKIMSFNEPGGDPVFVVAKR